MRTSEKDGGSGPVTGRRTISQARSFGAAIFCLCLAVLAAHARYYFPFLADDALISLRYVQRFLNGQGLTWTDGPPVEGYSNLLWMLLTAMLEATGLDGITSVRILGLVATMGVVVALGHGFLRRSAASAVLVALGCLTWVLAGPTAAWALAGLEQPLVACFLAWSLVLMLRRTARPDVAPRVFVVPGVLFGALCLTRLDGPLFVLVITPWLMLQGRSRRAAMLQCAWLWLVPASMIAAQLLFRRTYYGEWLPNVAYVKISPSSTHCIDGLEYIAHGIAALRPIAELSLLAIGFLCWMRSTRSHGLLLLALCIAWAAYLCFIGGDIFPAWRHMLPMLVVFLIADLLALEHLVASGSRRAWKWLPLVFVVLAWFAHNQFRNEKNRSAKHELWEWNGQVVGLVLKRGFAARQPLLAVTAAGAVPYWSELPALDLFGLNDHHIARTRPPGWGEGMLGHEVGDAAYVLSRQPDLILFGTPEGREPSGMYGSELGRMPEFSANYDFCNFAGTIPFGFTSRIWVHRNSKKVGIERRPGEIFVPPYLLNFTGGALTRLDERDRFFVTVSPERPLGIGGLEIASGLWFLADSSPALSLHLVDPQSDFALQEERCGGRICIRVPTAGRYIAMLECTAPAPVPAYGLRLRSD